MDNMNEKDINTMYSDLTKLIITASDESIPKLQNVHSARHKGNICGRKPVRQQ